MGGGGEEKRGEAEDTEEERERERVRGRERERERAGVAIARSTANRGEEPDGSGTEQTDRLSQREDKVQRLSEQNTIPASIIFIPTDSQAIQQTERFHWSYKFVGKRKL